MFRGWPGGKKKQTSEDTETCILYSYGCGITLDIKVPLIKRRIFSIVFWKKHLDQCLSVLDALGSSS